MAQIIDDEKMPITEDGVRAEICLNPLGVIGRLNPSQMQESYINFMSDHVLRIMKSTEDYDEKAKVFFEYIKYMNKEQFDFFDTEYLIMNRNQRKEFIDNIERDGIYIHQAPFFGNTTEDQFKKIFVEHPEWCTNYNFVGIEKPMTMGDVYFIRLKHEPRKQK